MEKCKKLNVIVVPVSPKCFMAWRRPKPFMASGIAVISGQAAVISSSVKTSLLSFKASSDNFDSCRTIL